MIYPAFLKSGDGIGVTAPSDGNKKETDFICLDHAKKVLESYGFTVRETPDVRQSIKGKSGTAKIRAKEFMELVTDKEVKAIISAKGGDFLVEILSILDFNKIKENPVWFQGYSDNTGLTFTITTLCGIASIYGNHFNSFGMKNWHKSVQNDFDILQGNIVIQHSYEKYEDGFYDKKTGLEGYILTEDVSWKNIYAIEKIEITGRLLGGCLDVLLTLAGTKFDQVKQFIKTYQKDGILWYLESFDLSSEDLVRGLWQLKEAGWFQYAKGFVFGRPCFFCSDTDTSYEEAVLSVLEEYKVPIILDADIGHKAPQFTIVNGAIGTFYMKNGKGTLTQKMLP